MNEFVPTHPTEPATVGCLAAVNASLWCVVADADVGRGWKGGSGDDPNDDFTRAMEFCEEPGALISIASGQGVVALPNGRYAVWVDELEHEDELGMFESRLRIVRA